MHFRERNRVVQVIRTTYDRRTQKGRPEIVARLSKARPAITEDVRKACSADELREIEAWIAANSATPAASEPAAKPRARLRARRADRAAVPAARGAKAARPRRTQEQAAPAPTRWTDPKASAAQLIAQLDQAILWFRRNEPTEERKAIAAGLALRMHRVRSLLRKKGWIAQKSGADPA